MSVSVVAQTLLPSRQTSQVDAKTPMKSGPDRPGTTEQTADRNSAVKVYLTGNGATKTAPADPKTYTSARDQRRTEKFLDMQSQAKEALELRKQKLKGITSEFADQPRKLARELHKLGLGLKRAMRTFERAQNGLAELNGRSDLQTSRSFTRTTPDALKAYGAVTKSGNGHHGHPKDASWAASGEAVTFADEMNDFAKTLEKQFKAVERTARAQGDDFFFESPGVSRADRFLKNLESMTAEFERDLRHQGKG